MFQINLVLYLPLSIFRGPETLQLSAAKWSHHCSELDPWRRTWHLLQNLDKSWHWDGTLHRQGHFTRACGSLQEQQSHVGGRLRSTGAACMGSFFGVYPNIIPSQRLMASVFVVLRFSMRMARCAISSMPVKRIIAAGWLTSNVRAMSKNRTWRLCRSEAAYFTKQ